MKTSDRARRPSKLSVRLMLTYAVVFSVTLVLLSVAVILGTKYFLVQGSYKDVEQTAQIIEERVLDEYFEGEALDDPEVMQGYASDPALNVILLDPAGAIITNHRNFDAPMFDWRKIGERASELNSEGMWMAALQCEVYVDETLIATALIVRSLRAETEFLSIMTRLLAVIDVAGVLISLCVGYVVSRRMLNPIKAMTQTAKRISMSAFGERLAVSASNDELAGLAQTFNSMLDRLQLAFELQGRFVADASHELRTPLMVIQGYIDMLNRWGKHDEAVRQEAIDAISQEAVNMSELTQKLLFLARGDSGRQTLDKSTFDVRELIEELEREYALVSSERNFAFTCPNGICFFADRGMIKQMLRALLDNAVKYTPPGGNIDVSAESSGESIRMMVQDNGIGIEAAHIAHIFDRFYRVDKARTKSSGGNGLGLSLVHWIVKAHGGDIHVKSALGEGASVEVVF